MLLKRLIFVLERVKGDGVELVDIILPACAVGTADRFNPDILRPSASHKKITIAKESMNQ